MARRAAALPPVSGARPGTSVALFVIVLVDLATAATVADVPTDGFLQGWSANVTRCDCLSSPSLTVIYGADGLVGAKLERVRNTKPFIFGDYHPRNGGIISFQMPFLYTVMAMPLSVHTRHTAAKASSSSTTFAGVSDFFRRMVGGSSDAPGAPCEKQRRESWLRQKER